MLVEEQ